MRWLKDKLRAWLGVSELDGRLLTVERHFVTKRDDKGRALQTLDEVPLKERKDLKPPRGMSWPQYRRYMEETDGGRNLLQ